MTAPSFSARLALDRPLLLDGATGTELNRRGFDTMLPLWSARAVVDAPEMLYRVHADYVDAGAEILTACTFRTNQRTLLRSGTLPGGLQGARKTAAEWTRRAVEIARRAAGSRAWVAGSQAPVNDCYEPTDVPPDEVLREEHREMSENLSRAGVDLILVETMNTVREAVIATSAARETGLPVFVSFVCGNDGRLLSGETLTEALRSVSPMRPSAVLVNCLPADLVEQALAELASLQAESSPAEISPPCPMLGAYANIGRPDPRFGWVNTDASDPEIYAARALGWLKRGAQILGGCCGTQPAHIREICRVMQRQF